MSLMSDIIVFAIYITSLLYIGWRAKRENPSGEEYLLSSRSLTTTALVATLVTTWYGGILGIGEFVYLYGISAWIVFGLPYYIFAALFAIFIAPKIRLQKYQTIPDLLYQSYGKAAGLTGSFLIMFITSPAPYILISAIILKTMFDLPLSFAILITLLFSIFYLFKGGFRSVVQTDKLQFILMFGGFLTLLIYLMACYGSPLSIIEKLPPTHLELSGGLSVQSLIVWFLIASWTFIDPGFHQRSAAAQSPGIARKGILISILFWFIFDMLTLWTGIYAVIIIQNADPLMIYPLIAEKVLPDILKSIFLMALLATAMSTTDSFTFISAQTFGRDIIATWNKKDSDAEIKHYTQIGLFITAAISVLLIWLIPSVVELWYTIGSLFIPPLLFPILIALFKKQKPGDVKIVFLMLGSFVLTVGWFVYGQLYNGYPFQLEPFIPGLIFSLMAFINIKRKRPD